MGNAISTRKFHTNRTWAGSLEDLARIFDRWGIERGEWGANRFPNSNGAEVYYYLPYDPSRKSVSSLAQGDASTNLRQCVMTVTELQRASVRGVAIRSGKEELMALPTGAPGLSGVKGSAQGHVGPQPERRRSAFKGLKEACQVLGITPESPESDAIDMRRIRLARYHPESSQTPDEAAFKRVQEAFDFIRERKGWGAQE